MWCCPAGIRTLFAAAIISVLGLAYLLAPTAPGAGRAALQHLLISMLCGRSQQNTFLLAYRLMRVSRTAPCSCFTVSRCTIMHRAAGLVDHPSVTPIDLPSMRELPQFGGDYRRLMLWGSYRPGLYFGTLNFERILLPTGRSMRTHVRLAQCCV